MNPFIRELTMDADVYYKYGGEKGFEDKDSKVFF